LKYVLENDAPGQVPGLEWIDSKTKEKRFLAESLVIADYLDEIYPEHRLHPQDPYLKAKQRILIERFGNVTSGFYKIVREDKTAVDELLKSLSVYENALTGNFFGGDSSPTMIDYMLWPWFERLPLLKERGFDFDEEKKQFPKLSAWIAAMNSSKPVKDIQIPLEKTKRFMEGYRQGQPVYDDVD